MSSIANALLEAAGKTSNTSLLHLITNSHKRQTEAQIKRQAEKNEKTKETVATDKEAPQNVPKAVKQPNKKPFPKKVSNNKNKPPANNNNKPPVKKPAGSKPFNKAGKPQTSDAK